MSLLEFQCRHRMPGGFEIDVAFALDRRFNVLFGPSGAGKTTILSIIAGLTRPDEGRVRIGNRALFEADRRVSVPIHDRAVGIVFQDALLFPHLSVRDNLRFGRYHRKAPKRRVDFARVVEVLEIGRLLDRFPAHLSGGEKQRVALGRALLSGPELLLMDEPLASLDVPLRMRVLSYLERIVAEWDVPTLYVTHSQAEVRRAADWVIVVRNGRVLAEGLPDDALGRGEPLAWSNSTGPANLLRLDRVETTDHGPRAWVGRAALHLPPREPSLPVSRFVQFSPADVVLSRQEVSGVSARNQLRGRVCRMMPSDRAVFVAVDVGQILWAEVTPTAVAELELAPGNEVVCLLKTHCLTPLE